MAARAATAVLTSTSPRRRCRAWESVTGSGVAAFAVVRQAVYSPAQVLMSLACGATVKSPRRVSASTTWACWPQQHTTPAAYDAHRAALASVAGPPPGTSSSIQTRASMRRTPSTNSNAAGGAWPGSGSTARHWPAGSSTFTSTLAVDSPRYSSSSRLVP